MNEQEIIAGMTEDFIKIINRVNKQTPREIAEAIAKAVYSDEIKYVISSEKH